MSNYVEQLDRLKRSYARLSQIDKGKKHDSHSEDYTDEFYTFFSNCYHLKDWLKNDSSFNVAGQVVEEFINQESDLLISADICNAHKHLVLTNPRSSESPSVGGQITNLTLGLGDAEISIKFIVDTTSGPKDGFELATNCLHLWEGFINQHAQ